MLVIKGVCSAMPKDTDLRRDRASGLDQRRYRRVLRFFGSVMLSVIWWEIVIRALLGGAIVARRRSERLRRYARDFRVLAVEMGGVLIKLGQFVSARIDVMPPEVVEELDGLQDEVPPETLNDILQVVKAEMGVAPDELFAHFEHDAQAAASLGQVHRALLASGERVAVKIQRPYIERMVATDLAALELVARWTMYWPLINKRADVPALLGEFAQTLWEELDYKLEAGNAERFKELFADDPYVYVPAIFQDYSSGRVLTMEDVANIKILDHAAIDAVGIERSAVAYHLLDLYLRMIFDFNFFHADPHPGNLFIHPLPRDKSGESLEQGGAEDSRPFRIVFVDFGMVGHITGEVKAGLRELLIAIVERDAQRVLEAYQILGVLLPSADLDRIREAEQEVLDYIWGKSIPDLTRMAREDLRDFAVKYRDLLYQMPFQIPQNFIYLARAVGILSGICTSLDPGFNPWEPIGTYAQKLLSQEIQSGVKPWIQEILSLGQMAVGLPRQLQEVLERIQRGEIEIQVRASEALQGDLHRLETAISGVMWAMVLASVLVTATMLYVAGYTMPGLVGFALSGIAWMALLLRHRKP